jgi:hypothetical protein
MTHRIAAFIEARRLALRADADRGEGPVSAAIIIAGLAVLAAAVVAWAVARANHFMDTAPGGK